MAYMKIPDWAAKVLRIENKGPLPETGKNQISPDTSIIAKIFGEFADLAKKTISDWRSAQQAAYHPENPKWNILQDLYEYFSDDAHLGSQRDILKGTILSTRHYIRDRATGQENPDKTKLFQKEWFYNLVSDLLDSIEKHYTVCQLINTETMVFEVIPRRNIVPQHDFVRMKISEDTGVYYTDPFYANTIICMKSRDKYGILNDVITQLIYKKYAEQAWAILTERFGLPLLTATTNKQDKKTLDAIEAGLKKLGQAAQAVLPEGTTMKAEFPANQSDPHKLFDQRIERSNTEISKRYLGGTMVSDNGSSRSQSEVHERTLNNILGEQYRKRIEFVINDQLLPLMQFWKKDINENDEFVFDRKQQLTMPDKWKIVKEANDIYEIDPEWVSKTFELPIIKVKDKPQPGTPGFNKPTSALASALVGKGISFPVYKASGCNNHGQVIMQSFPGNPLLTSLSDLILEYLWEGKDTLILQLSKSLISGGMLRDALFESWQPRRLEIGYDAVDHRALASMEMNLFHFSAAREKASVLTLNELLLDKEAQGIRSFSDFKSKAAPHLENMNRHYLETEYNFTIAVGQNTSRYQQFMEEIDTVTNYVQYQTIGDSKVRAAHAALDGLIFDLNDKSVTIIWTPNGFGCRCELLQYLGDPKGKVISGSEAEKLLNWSDKEKKMFGVNRADTGEVFTQDQQYIKNNGFAADIKSMTYDKYGLKKSDDERKGKPALKIDKTIIDKNVAELFDPVEGTSYMGFKDHLNRSLILNKKVFDSHTTGANLKQGKHQLFPYVDKVLSDPDEVYFTEWKDKKFQINYVKHYKNMSLVVNGNLGKNNMEITTWYELKNESVRSGLLIHQKKKP